LHGKLHDRAKEVCKLIHFERKRSAITLTGEDKVQELDVIGRN